MKSYGALDSVQRDAVADSHYQARFKTISAVRRARIGIVGITAAVAAITVLVIARQLRVETELVVVEPPDDNRIILPPSEDDVRQFQNESQEILQGWNVVADQTDLPDACGISLDPCVVKIGRCANKRIVKTDQGKLTPATSTCNCFVDAYTKPIPVPTSPSGIVTCPFHCVDTILKYLDEYVISVNGPNDGVAGFCSNAMDILSTQEFANSDQYIPTEDDVASLDTMPVDDPTVLRATEALAIYINGERTSKCPILKPVNTNGTEQIMYAKKGMVDDGRGQYRLEVAFDDEEVFFARVAHLPKDEQLIDPFMVDNDPDNLGGRFVVVDTTPDPCDNAIPQQLAVSASGVQAINKQKLPWKAALREVHEGRTIRSFGLGFIPLPRAERLKYMTQLDTTAFTPPVVYDARDTLPGTQPCNAYIVLNQGSCGSCYAFSSATAYAARMCRFYPGSIGNTVMSPQEMMDCTNGCNGGNPVVVYQSLTANPAVEMWCDTYIQKKGTCGNVCQNGNTYTTQSGSVRTVGGPTSDGILQMQLELIQNGPGVVSFTVYNDFQSYSSGIYVKSANATQIGAHAVTLIGWGTDNGIPYWLIQNSWGPAWGLNGFFKIRRGTNECGIENNGLTVVRPLPPAVCSSANCQNNAVTRKDCTCGCQGGWTGSSCSTCSLTCLNGGVLNSLCTSCSCPLGFFGKSCEGSFVPSTLAACARSSSLVTLTYSFGGTATAPTQKSFIGIYTVQQTQTLSYATSALVCGSTYSASLNGGLCPSKGSVSIYLPTTPGNYQIVLLPFIPPNEFGQSGYATLLQASNILAQFTVLPSTCTATDLKVASAANSPLAILQASIAAAAAAAAANQAQMTARLQALQPLLASLNAQVPASVNIVGVTTGVTRLWMNGPPFQICYRLPQSANINPKALLLFVGTSSSYYPTGLTGAGTSNALPTDYQGCITSSFAAGLPSGVYTINLVDASSPKTLPVLAGAAFNVSTATVSINSYGYSSTQLLLKYAVSPPHFHQYGRLVGA